MSRWGRALRDRWPELSLLGLGLLVRFLGTRNFPALGSYDFQSHWTYVLWFGEHKTLPAPDLQLETFHPPLYYVLGGLLVRMHGKFQVVRAISLVAGGLRLGVFQLGLERFVSDRFARLCALALAALLPASVMVDMSIGAEALAGLEAAIALYLAARALESDGRQRWRFALAAAGALALMLLTKVSALVLIGAIGLVVGIEALVCGGDLGTRLRRAAPFVAGLALVAASTGWYFARNHRLKGKWFLTSYDTQQSHWMQYLNAMPVLDRRPLGFLIGWNREIHGWPFSPSGTTPNARFVPVLVASTFDDYYCNGFSPLHKPPAADDYPCNGRTLRRSSLPFARAAFHAGLVIALTVVLAWLAAIASVWRRRDLARLLLLVAPLAAFLALLAFTIEYAINEHGVVKGSYLQFAALPLSALFGLAVAWLRDRVRPLALVPLVALATLAVYTLVSRLTF
jgi:hypothetical protein